MDEDYYNNEGYPTEEELQLIEKWDYKDVFGLFEYLKGKWAYSDWGYKEKWGKDKYGKPVLKVELHTAGWSGNESLIESLLKNRTITMFWYSQWNRGGHYYFDIVPFNIGYVKVNELSKKLCISRQAIHRYKENYDWIKAGKRTMLCRRKS
jgi:hypothetical protein